MSRFTAWIALLILIGSVWSQLTEEKLDDRSPRFGFDLLDPLRKFFCDSSCTSPRASPLMNITCTLKCPELYGTSTTVKPEKPNTDTTAVTPTNSPSTTAKSSEKPSSDSTSTTTSTTTTTTKPTP